MPLIFSRIFLNYIPYTLPSIIILNNCWWNIGVLTKYMNLNLTGTFLQGRTIPKLNGLISILLNLTWNYDDARTFLLWCKKIFLFIFWWLKNCNNRVWMLDVYAINQKSTWSKEVIKKIPIQRNMNFGNHLKNKSPFGNVYI